MLARSLRSVRRSPAPGIASGVLALVACLAAPSPATASRPEPPSVSAEQVPTDASLLPRNATATVVAAPSPGKTATAPLGELTVGWTRSLLRPPFVDPRRRIPATQVPDAFGSTLRVGERFRFDLTFAGNPAGLAEASVAALEPDPRGPAPYGAPIIRLEGHARTSGVVSLLATITDDVVSRVDARTGATVSATSVINISGWGGGKYKRRVTEHDYQGRGFVHITDTKDEDAKEKSRRVPVDTFDPLAAMAWVRSLDLAEGARAKAHVLDGTTLLRVELQSRGRQRLADMPSIGIAMGLDPAEMVLLEGTMTRVDRYGQPLPGRRSYTLRAWISGDERRIPLVLESDMWVGALRLALTGYDPPPRP